MPLFFPPVSEVSLGKSLFVDSVNGNDSSGSAGRLDKPFATCGAAKDAASSGDIIYVGPGAYTVTTSLLKNEVNWHFASGASVNYTNNATDAGLLDDLGVAVNCRITGNGTFTRTEASIGSMSQPRLIQVNHADSDVYIEGHECSFISSAAGAAAYTIWGVAGKLVCRFAKIEASHSASDSAIAVTWTNGPMDVAAEYIISTFYCVISACSAIPTGDLYVNCDTMEVAGAVSGEFAIAVQGTNADAAAWIRVATLKITGFSVGSRSILCEGPAANKLYVTAQKIFGLAENQSGYLGLSYIEALKWSAVNNQTAFHGLFVRCAAGTMRVKCLHWDAVTFINSCAWACSGGALFLSGGDFTAVATGGGFRVSGGIARLSGMQINTIASSTRSPVLAVGGLVILGAGVVLLAEATQDSISASTAQTVKAYGAFANKAVDADVTIVPSAGLTVDSNVE